jgi:ABC-type antimicrobial peptide transport system permease subunit
LSPVIVRARTEMRARLFSMIALALLVGLGTGAVMTTAAGARRTDSSYKRFARAYKAADMQIYPPFSSDFANIPFNKVEQLPQVEAAALYHFIFSGDQAGQIAAGDARYGTLIDRPKVLEGRMPAADSLDEVAVSFTLAKNQHLRVGSPMTLPLAAGGFDSPPKPFEVTLRVVGIEVAPGEFPPSLNPFGSNATETMHVSDAFYQSMKKRGVFSLDSLLLRFRRGSADFGAVVKQLNELAKEVSPPGQVLPQLNQNLDDQEANVQRSIHLQAVALWIVGGLVALIGLLVLSQLLARQAVLDSRESPTLLALGMTRTQIWLTGMGRAAVLGLAGAILGVVIAILASPLMPLGVAGKAEPNPGFSFDLLVLGLGVLAAVVVVLLLAAWPVWKSATITRRDLAGGSAKPSLVARTAALPGLAPPVSTGVRLALESGRGVTEVPVRSSLFSVTLAIAALASALTFGAGMNHLLDTPRLYGWNWSANITTSDDTATADPGVQILGADPRVSDIAVVDTPPLGLGQNAQLRFDSVVLRQEKGLLTPMVVDGRAPAGPHEVALGTRTLHDAHAHIGSTVLLQITAIPPNPTPFKVVGTVVIPPNSDSARLGSGAVLTIDGEKSMIPAGVQAPPLTDAYFRLAPGVNEKAALADLKHKLEGTYDLILPKRPNDLVNFGQVQNLPLLLAGLVALLAAATLAHTLVTSIRRRRRDLAILKMLGFVPSQVRWAVAWQATTFVSVALLIGLPLGIAIGRTIWSFFATQLGTISEPITPSLPLLLTIPAAVVLANLIAVAPATIAGRMRPALVLRAE